MPEKKRKKPKKSDDRVEERSVGDKEVDAMLKRAHKMDDWLQGKVSDLCDKSGHSRKKVMEFLENSNNIPKDVLDKAQQDAKVLEQKIVEIFGKKAKTTVEDKKQKKATKGRKGKFLGARKKWLQM